MTCSRRLRDWNDAGVWQRLHEVLLGKLRINNQLDMSRAVIDGSHVRALIDGSGVRALIDGSGVRALIDGSGVRALKGDPKPVQARSTAASQARTPRHHRGGRHPLAVSLIGGNCHDVTQLMPLVDKIP
ncbi:hypothetical protein DKT68_19810 [Micromonospora acroterricola]|uniref:Transposase n=1 Tax=Micromonospora acroterricola TaxID=2202421 RepID=A0A317D0H4_9ACTN|nr:hypothetical protein DKT68_19810 [Micromonospora acroterricola]